MPFILGCGEGYYISKSLNIIVLDSGLGSDHVPSGVFIIWYTVIESKCCRNHFISIKDLNGQEIKSQIFCFSERNDKGYRQLDANSFSLNDSILRKRV